MTANSSRVVARMQQAQNRHDVDAFVACFAPNYQSAQSMHPNGAARGRDQVRANWSIVFRDIPDFQADILRVCTTGDMVWTEWRWRGTPASGGRFNWHGVTVFRIQDDHITWGHFYMESDQTVNTEIDGVAQHRTTEAPADQTMT